MRPELRPLNLNGVPILLYHRIASKRAKVWSLGASLPPDMLIFTFLLKENLETRLLFKSPLTFYNRVQKTRNNGGFTSTQQSKEWHE